MFTQLQLATSQTITAGSLVVGKTSGARGYVVDAVSADPDVTLYAVEGNFQDGEMVTVDGLDKDTISKSYVYQYSDTRQIVSKDESTSAVEFTADIVLEDLLQLQGATFTYDATGSAEKITGTNSNFSIDLRAGDRIYFSATKYVDVDAIDPTNLASSNNGTIFNYANQTVNVTPGAGGAAPTAGDYTVLIRYRAKLFDANTASLLEEMPRPYVKSISDESMIVRRTFDAQTVASSSIAITLPANEQFEALSNANYTFTVLASTNGTYPVGDQIPIDTTNTGALGYTTFTSSDRTTLQMDNLTNITSVKVTASISKNVTTKKTKSPQKMFVLKTNKTINNLDKQNYNLAYSNLYGTRIEDQDISLGLVDAYKIHAVYESLDDSDPEQELLTLTQAH